MDRMKKLLEVIRELIGSGFTGYLRINFSQGSLGRIEKSEDLEETAQAAGKPGGFRNGSRSAAP